MTQSSDTKPLAPASPDGDLEMLLRQALEREPARLDLRLKLLRIYFIAGKARDFLREAGLYRERLAGQPPSVEWQAITQMGRALAPDSPLFRPADDLTVEWVPQAAEPGKTEKSATIRRFGEDEAARELLREMADAYAKLRQEPRFIAELDLELTRVGRPTPLYPARRLSEQNGGALICLKREDLAMAGTRLAIHVSGQALLARRMGKDCLVTGTLDGQKGVVMAAVAARLGLQARVFMEKEQMQRQTANVMRMHLMGAQVEGKDTRFLRNGDIREAALAFWLENPRNSFLIMGLDAGPEPYPTLSLELSAVIGRECRRQTQALTRKSPALLVARGGDNADAIGFFEPFLAESGVRLACVEPASHEPSHAGADSGQDIHRMQLSEHQHTRAKAILEGLEYPSVTREHKQLRATGRVEYVPGNLQAGLEMLDRLGRLEGMLPALETAQALAWACEAARPMAPDQMVLVMLSERVDKDIWDIERLKKRRA